MLALALAGAVTVAAGACRAPTQHTGKRPVTSRRVAETTPDKTMQERLAEHQAARAQAAAEEARTFREGEGLVGVGSTHVFHFDGCSELADVPRADRVIFVSPFDALDGGYDPCRTCNPGP